jgi:hypothetical protein
MTTLALTKLKPLLLGVGLAAAATMPALAQ